MFPAVRDVRISRAPWRARRDWKIVNGGAYCFDSTSRHRRFMQISNLCDFDDGYSRQASSRAYSLKALAPFETAHLTPG